MISCSIRRSSSTLMLVFIFAAVVVFLVSALRLQLSKQDSLKAVLDIASNLPDPASTPNLNPWSDTITPNLVEVDILGVAHSLNTWRVQVCIDKPLHSRLWIPDLHSAVKAHRGGDVFGPRESRISPQSMLMEPNCGRSVFFMFFPEEAFVEGEETKISICIDRGHTLNETQIYSRGVRSTYEGNINEK